MPFADFHGNSEVVRTVREMLARERFPHAVILSGPAGSGKFTLAQMIAKTMNCLERSTADGLPDFCGRCANCVRIAEADHLEDRFAEAVEARENLREADKRETRILVQTHPDVLIIPPDPPQMLVKVDQVRHVISEIYYKPAEGRERVYIFSDADFMKEAANSLLKILEEPPEFATIFLTILRRCCLPFGRVACSCGWRRSLLRRWKSISRKLAPSGRRASVDWWRGCAAGRWAGRAASIWRSIWQRVRMRWRYLPRRWGRATIRSCSRLPRAIARAWMASRSWMRPFACSTRCWRICCS